VVTEARGFPLLSVVSGWNVEDRKVTGVPPCCSEVCRSGLLGRGAPAVPLGVPPIEIRAPRVPSAAKIRLPPRPLVERRSASNCSNAICSALLRMSLAGVAPTAGEEETDWTESRLAANRSETSRAFSRAEEALGSLGGGLFARGLLRAYLSTAF